MKLISPSIKEIENTIKTVDDKYIASLAKIAFECNRDTERWDIRDKLYTSKYTPKNLEQKEAELERYLNSLNNSNIKTKNQNKEYKWVQINSQDMGNISSRFYIAPNPINMHQMVKKLVEAFSSRNIPVAFKYQLTTEMEQCDRIIIYSDTVNKDKVEAAIKSVYQKNPVLFIGYERSIGWLYDTSIPGVYNAPETPGDAYSNRLADAIIDASKSFCFLYGITDNNSNITFTEKEAERANEYMEAIISSMMLRKGILLSKDGRCINIKDNNVRAFYDVKTGVLKNNSTDEFGFYHEVKFEPTPEGRRALFKNFYNVSVIKPQAGLTIRHLTAQERKEELDRALYPHLYNQTNNGDTPRDGMQRL